MEIPITSRWWRIRILLKSLWLEVLGRGKMTLTADPLSILTAGQVDKIIKEGMAEKDTARSLN